MDRIEEVARRYVFPQAVPNHLAVERSIRSLPYWKVCSGCKGMCCTNMRGIARNVDHLFNEFDKVVFPEWESYAEKEGEKIPYPKDWYGKVDYQEYCPFNSDEGCIIPEGRPAVCTAYVCNDKHEMDEQRIPHEIVYDVMLGHYRIGIALSGLVKANTQRSREDIWYERNHMESYYNVRKPQIEDRISFINSALKRSSEVINSNEAFKEKFSFKRILMPNGI